MSADTRTPDGVATDGKPARPASFAEEALRLGGKGAEEVRRMGAVDAADEQVEALFAAKYRTEASPIHRAVWDAEVPAELWNITPRPVPPAAEQVMRDSIAVVRKHRDGGTLYDENRKVREAVLAELGGVGYWGLLVEPKYGGSGVPFSRFAPFLTRMSTVDPTTAGLA